MHLVVNTDSWEATRKLGKQIAKGTNWVFRGQSDVNWELSTTFERNMKLFSPKIEKRFIKVIERNLINSFKGQAVHYLANFPSNDEDLEWLALLQHYGGPTRLLDFTYSLDVAAFFAIEKAEKDASVWAINLEVIDDELYSSIKFIDEEENDYNLKYYKEAERCLRETKSERMIVWFEPKTLHDRQVRQKGLFLFPCDINTSFMKNLILSLPESFRNKKIEVYDCHHDEKIDYGKINQYPLIKIVIPRESHKYALQDLREMNITSTILFPGLEGFARSLHYIVRTWDIDDESYTYT